MPAFRPPHQNRTLIRPLSSSTRRCFDDRWERYIPYDAAMILVYPVGIPLSFLYLLLK